MKPLVLFIVLCRLLSAQAYAQSTTTEALQKQHSDAFTLFFYNNTLRMLNQAEDQNLDELIKDIEKMRFLLIKKAEAKFDGNAFKKLVSDYKSENFEAVMSSRHEGKNFDIYLKEQGGKTKGMLVLVNDADNLYVLDILGKIALDKVTTLYSTLNENTDIGKKIKQFIGEDAERNDDNQSPEKD